MRRGIALITGGDDTGWVALLAFLFSLFKSYFLHYYYTCAAFMRTKIYNNGETLASALYLYHLNRDSATAGIADSDRKANMNLKL